MAVVGELGFGKTRSLEDHYSMSAKIAQKKWCAAYSRCINALSEYQRLGNVNLYLSMDKRTYTFPDGFKQSAQAYLSYRKKQVLLRNPIRYSACILSVFLHFSSRETS